MKKRLALAAFLAVMIVIAVSAVFMARPAPVRASDHDDGETDIKTRNTNLTDLYVFKEEDQATNTDAGTNAGGAVVAGKSLIYVLNLNPRSLPRQQYFFNQKARYEIHVAHLANSGTVGQAPNVTGLENQIMRFTFGAPNAAGQQAITLAIVPVVNGVNNEAAAVTFQAGLTNPTPAGVEVGGTALNNGTAAVQGTDTGTNPLVNQVAIGNGNTLQVFAGLREDPFFFDVTQFFRVRAGLLGKGPSVGFRTAGPDTGAGSGTGTAIDFTKDYNVLSIVIRAPLTFLAQGTGQTTFDNFAIITFPQ